MVECPYCKKDVEIIHDDGYGHEQGVKHNQECDYCGKTFTYTTEISFCYEAEKAPCLNGGKHKFKPTMTFPKKYTKMECQACGEQREPNKKEWKLINS